MSPGAAEAATERIRQMHDEAARQCRERQSNYAIFVDIGSYPQAGKPIDPSPDGPLGPLRPVSAALPPIAQRPSGAPHTTTTGTVSRCHAQ